MDKLPRTQRGATRQWNALLRAYRRNWAGGGMFGFDWATMRLNDQDTYYHLAALRHLFDGLPR
jgi:hypothetical protein